MQRASALWTIEGREQDVFIPADKTKGAMDGDKVQIVIEGEKPEENVPKEQSYGYLSMPTGQ